MPLKSRHCFPYTLPRSPYFAENSSSSRTLLLNISICSLYCLENSSSTNVLCPKSVISGPLYSSLSIHFLNAHSFQILFLFSNKNLIFVSPLINQSNSDHTRLKFTFLVVNNGKPSDRLNLI